jgi:hypothetical protein
MTKPPDPSAVVAKIIYDTPLELRGKLLVDTGNLLLGMGQDYTGAALVTAGKVFYNEQR